MLEKWLAIPGYEGYYEASNLGRIRRLDRIVEVKGSLGRKGYKRFIKGRNLSQEQNKVGYLSVQLCKNNVPKRFDTHQLIAITWLKFIPKKGLCINHIDGNKKNNCVDNLEILTHKENILHAFKIGIIQKKFKHPLTVLTKEQGMEILYLKKDLRLSYKNIADLYHCSVTAIKNVLSWLGSNPSELSSYSDNRIFYKNAKRKISLSEWVDIFNQIEKGCSYCSLARAYNVTPQAIRQMYLKKGSLLKQIYLERSNK